MKTLLDIEFALDETVRGTGKTTRHVVRKVVGYEVRYVLEGEAFSRRAEYLESVPVPQPSEVVVLRMEVEWLRQVVRKLEHENARRGS